MYESQIYTGDHKKANFRMYWDAVYRLGYLPLHAAHGITNSGKGIAVIGPSGTGKSSIIFHIAKTLFGDDGTNLSLSTGDGHLMERGAFAKTEGTREGDFLFPLLGNLQVVLENVALAGEGTDGMAKLGVDYTDTAMFGKNGRAAIPFSMFPNYDPRPYSPIDALIFVNRNDFDPPVMVTYKPGGEPLNAMLSYSWVEATPTGATTTTKTQMDAGATTDFRPDVGKQDIPRLREALASNAGKHLSVLEVNTGAVSSTKIRPSDTFAAINSVLEGTAALKDHPLRPGVQYLHAAKGIPEEYMSKLRPFDVAADHARRGYEAKLSRAIDYLSAPTEKGQRRIGAPTELQDFARRLLEESRRK
jgi:ATP-dependent phosphoenolpyruvate carboxykinase